MMLDQEKRELKLKFMVAALEGLCVNENWTPGMDQPSKWEQVARRAKNYADSCVRIWYE